LTLQEVQAPNTQIPQQAGAEPSGAHLIGGRRVAGDGEHLVVLNPATGEPASRIPVGGPDAVEEAVAAARAAFPAWSATDPAARAAALKDAAARLRAAAPDIARLVTAEMGKPLGDSAGGVDAGVSTMEQYAELGPLHRGKTLMGSHSATDLMVNGPRGVVALVTPWNDPIAVTAGLLAAAVVTGNTVVVKPSERSPLCVARAVETLAAALPDGVVNVVLGGPETGAALVSHPDIDLIGHVGSTRTGRSIAAAAAVTGAKVLLENGGCDPLIVDAGVDPVWAAGQAALGSFANAGQICVAVERIYVHQDVAEPFLAALVAEAEARVLGPGDDEATTLGPLVDRRHRELVHAHVTSAVEAGATLLTGGVVPEGRGAFYPATVLTGCTDDMAVMREETFGPVAAVRVVGSFGEALEAAARSSYGLAATVLTADFAHMQQAWRALDVGTVKVNSVFGGAPGGAAQPRRGSGQGFGYGPELLDEMTTTKVVHMSPPVTAETTQPVTAETTQPVTSGATKEAR
jgi:acyl-CoA reductase-like NAD-dependent aldehyde dehydrogenase